MNINLQRIILNYYSIISKENSIMIINQHIDFFVMNNLNRQDFLSYISEWNGNDDWIEMGHGFPSIHFDFTTQSLYLLFQNIDCLENIKLYKLEDFKFSINQRKQTLLFELNNNELDLGISFENSEFCVMFKALLIHYIQIRKIIRKKAIKYKQ